MTDLIEVIQNKFPDLVESSHSQCGDQTVVLKKEGLLTVMKYVQHEPSLHFNMLMDLTAVDYWAQLRKPRFDVVYHLYSTTKNHRLRIKVQVSEKECEVDSLTSFWPSANWFEREVWDMFGVKFKGHPNMKRILMYEEFKGHPLRKDYMYNKRQPLVGPVN